MGREGRSTLINYRVADGGAHNMLGGTRADRAQQLLVPQVEIRVIGLTRVDDVHHPK